MADSSPTNIATIRRRRRTTWVIVGIIGLVALLIALQVTLRYQRYRRFAEVEAGQLYRSGELKEPILRDVIQTHKLKTILTLQVDDGSDPEQQAERQVAGETGVQLLRVEMPGNGCGSFEALDRAADFMADPANRPILVHCAAGVQRTGAAYTAYRVKHCGWTLQQALDENRRLGHPIDEKPELLNHLQAYCAARLGSTTTQPAATQSSNTN